MKLTLGSNIASLGVQRQLTKVTADLGRSFTRLSSGLRINKASDDAAGLAISESLSTDERLYASAIRNANDGISALDIAEGALSELSKITIRIAELAEQSANGTLSATQRRALDDEGQALRAEFQRIAATTSFNGIELLDGTTESLSLQVGIDSSENSRIEAQLEGAASRLVGDLTFTESQLSLVSGTGGPGAIADFNEDGFNDIVEAPSGGSAEIFLGSEDGTFSTGNTYGGMGGRWMFAADVDNDQHVDLISSGNGSGSVDIRLGNGDGSFGSILTPGADNGLTYGDYNGDGNLDLAYSELFTDDGFAVRFGNGDGTFGGETVISGGTVNSNRAHSYDFDNDGDLDIAVSNNDAGGSLTIFENDGVGGFSESVGVLFTYGDPDAAFGDFNNDGYLDVVNAASGGKFEIALGNGDLTFTTSGEFDHGSGFGEAAVGDFDGDGNDDIVATDVTGSLETRIFTGDGTGSFSGSTVLGTVGTWKGLVVGDLNNDGVPDVAVGDTGSSEIDLYIQGAVASAGMAEFSLLTASGALSALDQMKELSAELARSRGSIGATRVRIATAVNNSQVAKESVATAASRIKDVDVATEAANLTRNEIRQQAAAAVLSQANQLPALALQLIGG